MIIARVLIGHAETMQARQSRRRRVRLLQSFGGFLLLSACRDAGGVMSITGVLYVAFGGGRVLTFGPMAAKAVGRGAEYRVHGHGSGKLTGMFV